MLDRSEELLEFEGCRINWRTKGEGEPLFFFHGAGGLVEWLPFYDLLASERRLYAPDHPGFGSSDEPDFGQVPDIAEFYIRLFGKLGLSDLDIVGSSLGGWIAAEIALRAPEAVRSLVLFAPAGAVNPARPPANLFEWDRDTLAAKLYSGQEHVRKMLDRPATPEMIGMLQKNRRTALKVASDPLLRGEFLERSLGDLRQPVLLVWGREDNVIPVETADIWLRDVPDSELVVFEQCGHLPFAEKPEESSRRTLAFFSAARSQK